MQDKKVNENEKLLKDIEAALKQEGRYMEHLDKEIADAGSTLDTLNNNKRIAQAKVGGLMSLKEQLLGEEKPKE